MTILKRLTEYLPVSRRTHNEAIKNIALIVDGLLEADANHSQIEASLIRMTANGKVKKQMKEKNNNDPAFM